MNARLLAQGYKPISNEITLQIPGFKKPVDCCFTEYMDKYGNITYQFITGSKYIGLENICFWDTNKNEFILVWEMAQKFDYTGLNIKEYYYNQAKKYINRPLSDYDKTFVDYLEMSENEQQLTLEKERKKWTKWTSFTGTHLENIERYKKDCQEHIKQRQDEIQKIKDFYNL